MMPIHLLEYLEGEARLEARHVFARWRGRDCSVISPFNNRKIGDLIVIALIHDPYGLEVRNRKEMVPFKATFRAVDRRIH